MATERYDKHSVLTVPTLEPKRHYESEGVVKKPETHLPLQQPDRELEIIDDLDSLTAMAELLPPEIGGIIKGINKVLSEDSQGKLILDIIKKQESPPTTSIKEVEITHDKKDESEGAWVVTPEHEEDIVDPDVDDIFSDALDFTVEVAPSDSLVELARKAYKDDDQDIKEYYTSQMTQMSARFYQVMSTLAMEAGMPDYSYLMMNFDGTAVSTDDPNQQHLIDSICKNQILYDQRLRQMNLTHTPENTLIMTRGFSAAEAQRERYLGEKFKQDMNDTAAALSNDLLEKARQKANDKYKEAAYNMYKYLDSATKLTNSMLNLKIDEGAAKAQLSNTGSDIFAITPPPEPTPDNIDDGFDTVQEQTQAGQKYVEDMQKDSKLGKEANDVTFTGGTGGGFGGGGSSGGSGSGGGFNKQSLEGAGDVPERMWKFLKGMGYNDFAAAGIMGNAEAESSYNPGLAEEDGGYGTGGGGWDDYNTGIGVFQWTFGRKETLKMISAQMGKPGTDLEVQMNTMKYEVENSHTPCAPNNMNPNCNSVEDAVWWWLGNYEYSAGAEWAHANLDPSIVHQDRRISSGQAAYDQFAKK